MSTLHQIWLGSCLPKHMQPWAASMRKLAAALGMQYNLADRNWLECHYALSPAWALLSAALDFLPNPTTASLISDWFRLRALADEPGCIYADTDFICQQTPTWRPTADIAFFGEKAYSEQLATGLTWCNGERGQAAAALMVREVEARLAQRLGSPTAPDFRSRFVEAVRTDKGKGVSLLDIIGPRYVRDAVFPKLTAAGFTIEAIPREVSANKSKLRCLDVRPSIVHVGCGSWRVRTGWDEANAKAEAEEAVEKRKQETRQNLLASLPPHLMPQGRAILPDSPATASSNAAAPDVPAEVRSLLDVPKDAKRVVVFSNVTKGFPDVPSLLRPGDWCIHLNRAAHMQEALQVEGTHHALIVRHGRNPETKLRIWYIPPVRDFEGAEQVIFVNDHIPATNRPWWKRYHQECPEKCPTTGFIAANLMRDLAPHLPLLLVGFDPATPHGTMRWKGHAWKNEAEWYARMGFHTLPPS